MHSGGVRGQFDGCSSVTCPNLTPENMDSFLFLSCIYPSVSPVRRSLLTCGGITYVTLRSHFILSYEHRTSVKASFQVRLHARESVRNPIMKLSRRTSVDSWPLDHLFHWEASQDVPIRLDEPVKTNFTPTCTEGKTPF